MDDLWGRAWRPAARSKTQRKLLRIGGLPEAGRRLAAGKIARPPTWFSSLFVGRRPIPTGVDARHTRRCGKVDACKRRAAHNRLFATLP